MLEVDVFADEKSGDIMCLVQGWKEYFACVAASKTYVTRLWCSSSLTPRADRSVARCGPHYRSALDGAPSSMLCCDLHGVVQVFDDLHLRDAPDFEHQC
jgi:hypothetical protein